MSVTNFEEHTQDLNELEISILPQVIDAFKKYDKSNPIKAEIICKNFNVWLDVKNIKLKMTPARVCKFCNYIRKNGKLPLIATSKGYYVSNDVNEINLEIQSLRERANSINAAADGLMKFFI